MSFILIPPKDFENKCKPIMQQKDLPRVRLNKSSKCGVSVIAIKDIIYHMRGILSTYAVHRKSSSQRSHVNRQQTVQNHLLEEQHRYKMQIWMKPHPGFTPFSWCTGNLRCPWEMNNALRNIKEELGGWKQMEWAAGSITTLWIAFLQHFEVGESRREKHEQEQEGTGA